MGRGTNRWHRPVRSRSCSGHRETADVGKRRRAGQAPWLLPAPTQPPWPGCGPVVGCSRTTGISPPSWYPAPGLEHPSHRAGTLLQGQSIPPCWYPVPTLPVTPCSHGDDAQLGQGVSGRDPCGSQSIPSWLWEKRLEDKGGRCCLSWLETLCLPDCRLWKEEAQGEQDLLFSA